ncbi:hypothetical protein CBOS2020_17360 [Clostridium botulinum]|nr:hypothetical protein CBOS2020_17360 [Clostridium botulinum]
MKLCIYLNFQTNLYITIISKKLLQNNYINCNKIHIDVYFNYIYNKIIEKVPLITYNDNIKSIFHRK